MASIIEIALALHQQGQLELAREIYKTIKETDLTYPESLHLIGVINLQQKKYEAALEFIKKSIALQPKNPQALNNLASTYIKLENSSFALEAYQNAIDIDPNFSEAYFNKANLLKQLNKVDDALVFYDQALHIRPTFTEALINKGNLLKEINRRNEALECYIKAISTQPKFAQAYYNAGLILNTLKRHEEAIKYFNEAVKISPDFAEAYSDLSTSLCENNQFTEAIDAANKAIALNPKHLEAHNNRGIVYGKINQYIKAIDDFQCSLNINPNKPETHFNLGNTYRELKQIDNSLEHYEVAIKLNPNYAEAYWNMACLYLLNGNYEAGWKLYEWRWKWDGFTSPLPFQSRQPLWLGQISITGKSILVISEQGLGDCIQFFRYVEYLAQNMQCKVIFLCYKPIAHLFRSKSINNLTIIDILESIPEHDFYCPILSLPLALAKILPNLACGHSSYLSATPSKVSYWKNRLGPPKKNRIGLVWSSSSGFKEDAKRSLNLVDLINHIPFQNFEFVCLQKIIKPNDQMHFYSLNSDIKFYGDELHDFSDTAALASCMDLVVSTCTSVPHMTAALGIPTWIMLSYVPDWRWGLEGETSAWYSSAKLYRQTEDRNWDTVITRVAQDLEHFMKR